MTISLTSIIKKLLVVFLVLSGIYFAKGFLIPLSIGGLLATLFLPLCRWMESKKIAKGIAVVCCLLALLLMILIILSVLGYKISELLLDISTIKTKCAEVGSHIQKYIFNNLNISVNEQLKILKNEQPSYSNLVQIMLSSITHFLSSFILLLVYFVFLLYHRHHIKCFLIQLTAKSEQEEMEQIIQKVTSVSQLYLLGLSKMIFLLWIMYGIGFSAIGLENAIFFAILCGLLEIIPFVGNIIGTTITVLLAAIYGGNVELLAGIVIVYGCVQFIQGWILEPLILGPQVKINSLFTIIALVLGELLWGIPGILLAIPLTAMIKIICDHIQTLKPYGFLIGEVKDTKSAGFLKKWINNLQSKK